MYIVWVYMCEQAFRHIADDCRALRQGRGPIQCVCVQTCGDSTSLRQRLWETESDYKVYPKSNSSWEEPCIYWTDPWTFLSRLLYNYKETAGKKDKINETRVKGEERGVCLWKNHLFRTWVLGRMQFWYNIAHVHLLTLAEYTTWFILPPSATDY